jgi:hypothetical protein
VAPEIVVAVRFNVLPIQTGLLDPALALIVEVLMVTEVVAVADPQPGVVTTKLYVPALMD